MNAEHITIGKFVLDNLTVGMYNDPLCIYREYVQNAADAIDKAATEEKKKISTDYEIRITLDCDEHGNRIVVEDNGCGCPVATAKKTLLSLGDSQKTNDRERGFRGIGRLGGIAYCDKLIFTTKTKNEADETQVVWDCKRVRQLLNRRNDAARGLAAKELIDHCVAVSVQTSLHITNESFFRVEMQNVRSAKGEIHDYIQVMSYLQEVAPLPFDEMQLHFGRELDTWLRKEIPDYNTYRIFINDTLLKKKYTQTLQIHNGKSDQLDGYEKFDIEDRHGKVIARGWFGKLKNHYGTLKDISGTTSGIDSIRVRSGNILIGNSALLDNCFRETRFNGWHIGEIHIDSPQLLPNGRRDDFQDCEMKSDFYHGVANTIGNRLSDIVRDASKKRNLVKPIAEAKTTIKKIAKQIEKGFVNDAAKKETLTTLQGQKEALDDLQHKRSIDEKVKEQSEKQSEQLGNLIDTVKNSHPSLRPSFANGKYSRKEQETIQLVLDAVRELYDKCNDKDELVSRVIDKLNRQRRS